MPKLFFALWPNERQSKQLRHMARVGDPGSSARYVPWEKIHLTLLFIGTVSQAQSDCLKHRVPSIHSPAFSIKFDRTGHWRTADVVWAGAREYPAALYDLVERLRGLARECNIQVNDRPYLPHITLIRRAGRNRIPQLLPETVELNAKTFSLVESEAQNGAVHYRTILEQRLAE